MELTGIKGSSGIQEILRAMREGEGQPGRAEEGAPVPVGDRETLSAQAGFGSSMMSGNFASAHDGESKYLSALKDGFAVEQQTTLSRNAIIVAAVGKAIAEAAFWYGDQRMRNAKQLKDSVESNAENFKEIREDMEERAAEALENTGQALGEDAAMPEINAGDVSSVMPPEVAPASAPASPSPAPEAPSVPGSTTPSLDLMV